MYSDIVLSGYGRQPGNWCVYFSNSKFIKNLLCPQKSLPATTYYMCVLYIWRTLGITRRVPFAHWQVLSPRDGKHVP